VQSEARMLQVLVVLQLSGLESSTRMAFYQGSHCDTKEELSPGRGKGRMGLRLEFSTLETMTADII